MARIGEMIVPYIRNISTEVKADIINSNKLSAKVRITGIIYQFNPKENGLEVVCSPYYKRAKDGRSSLLVRVIENYHSNIIRNAFVDNNIVQVNISVEDFDDTGLIDVFGYIQSKAFDIVQPLEIKASKGLSIGYFPSTLLSLSGIDEGWKIADFTGVLPNYAKLRSEIYRCFKSDIAIKDTGNNAFNVYSILFGEVQSSKLPKSHLSVCYSLLKDLSNIERIAYIASQINTIIVLYSCCKEEILYRLLENGEYEVIVSFS